MKYNFVMKFKTGDLYQGVRDLENSVNSFMQGFGFHEKMVLESECPIFTMEVDAVLTSKELQDIKGVVNEYFDKNPDLKMSCVDVVPDGG